jgi:16S rRNA (guanine527-N7)-methyltransferase
VRLAAGIATLGLILPAGAEAKLEGYLAMLGKWNRTYNLTAIRDPAQMVTHHLLDSLAILPHIAGLATLADVGSGGGLPGLPLAICRPDLQLTSVEANQKKAAFQRQAGIELALGNVSVHCGRVEALTGCFDAVVSRAFADLTEFVGQAGHLAPRLLAMKGMYPQAEIDHLPATWRVADTVKLIVPGLAAERHLIVLEKS